MRTIKFDDLDSYRDLRLVRKGVEIGAPETKTETVDVPGADGSLDLTEYFGEPLYDNRELKMDFQAVEMGRYPNIYPSAPVPCDMDVAEDGSITVYGATRQNLWENPSGTSNGVTATSNADGTLELSGTATGWAIPQTHSYVLRPGATYTLRVDKKLSDSVSSASLEITFLDADGEYISEVRVGYASTLTISFPVPANTGSVYMRARVASGVTVSGTYRIMLNEGSTAEPWCPPGLNGVDELSVVCAGKNLLTSAFGGIDYSAHGWVVYGQADMACPVALSGRAVAVSVYVDGEDVTGTAGWALYVGFVTGATTDPRLTLSPNVRSGTVGDVPPGAKLRFYANSDFWPTDCEISVQLELGTIATAYEPPQVTTTTIPLDGHTLNSLPDGTRDELSVDATGAVTLTKRVGVVEYAAGDFVPQQTEFAEFNISGAYAGGTDFSASRQFSDFAPIGNSDIVGSVKCSVYTQSGLNRFRTGSGKAESSAAAQVDAIDAMLGSATWHHLYALATPQTIELPSAFVRTRLDFQEIFAQAYNTLHGKRMRIQLSEEPGFYYMGRVALDSWKTNERTGDVTITADCEPYKYRATETVVRVSVSGSKTVTLRNLRKTVVPTFQLSAAMQVKQGSATYSASKGAWSDDRLRLAQGDNELTFTGTGTVEIRYQERGL